MSETAELVKRLRENDDRKCPFPNIDIDPLTPCPICGDVGEGPLANLPSKCVSGKNSLLHSEAADLIESQAKEIERLKAALEPFAKQAAQYDPVDDDDGKDPAYASFFRIDDMRRARSALASPSETGP